MSQADTDVKVAVEILPTHAPSHPPAQRGLLGAKSAGVQRIEAISRHSTSRDRVLVFLSVFLIAYAYGLDGTIRYTYQVTLTSHRLFTRNAS